jgi:thymidine phosphorylase
VGRERTEDKIIPSVGFEILVSPGDEVSLGQPLLKLHCNDKDDLQKYKDILLDAFVFEESSQKLRVLSKALEQNSLVMERIMI